MVALDAMAFPGYELGEQIAASSMAETFAARRTSDGLDVVIKIAGSSVDERTRSRLTRERQLLSAVHHDNVVRTIDSGTVQGRPFCVLERISGTPLRNLMQPGVPVSWVEVAPIVQQLSSALSALHQQQIIHRDVKPENVLIDDTGHVTLINLSVGCELAEAGNLTSQGEVPGTIEYMAPEQRHRLHFDEGVDQYALAAICFELLTGHCSMGQSKRPSELNRDLPASVDSTLTRGLERDPDDRFRSVADFTRSLMQAGPSTPCHLPSRNLAVIALCVMAMCLGWKYWPLQTEEAEPVAIFQDAQNSAPRSSLVANSLAQRDTFENSIGMAFVRIPAGQFRMGSDIDEPVDLAKSKTQEELLSESPAHDVQLTRPFWMATHEVTVATFRTFVEATEYRTTSEIQADERGRKPTQPFWHDPFRFDASDALPVIGVSWEDAQAFCQWLSEKEGHPYRLPTEAEWEYACRAGSTGQWVCERDALDNCAQFRRPWSRGPASVGQLQPNAWGLHDMHGNVWEWCDDAWSTSFYARAPLTDPVCRNGDASDLHVLRGGGFFAPDRGIRSARRRGLPGAAAHEDVGHAIGFRVVRAEAPDRVAARSR